MFVISYGVQGLSVHADRYEAYCQTQSIVAKVHVKR